MGNSSIARPFTASLSARSIGVDADGASQPELDVLRQQGPAVNLQQRVLGLTVELCGRVHVTVPEGQKVLQHQIVAEQLPGHQPPQRQQPDQEQPTGSPSLAKAQLQGAWLA